MNACGIDSKSTDNQLDGISHPATRTRLNLLIALACWLAASPLHAGTQSAGSGRVSSTTASMRLPETTEEVNGALNRIEKALTEVRQRAGSAVPDIGPNRNRLASIAFYLFSKLGCFLGAVDKVDEYTVTIFSQRSCGCRTDSSCSTGDESIAFRRFNVHFLVSCSRVIRLELTGG